MRVPPLGDVDDRFVAVRNQSFVLFLDLDWMVFPDLGCENRNKEVPLWSGGSAHHSVARGIAIHEFTTREASEAGWLRSIER